MKTEYKEFLESKVVVAHEFGFEPYPTIGKILPHAAAITQWAIQGGRRAIFASFGLTKTAMQLELAHQVIKHTNKPFLIVMPLNVVDEFRNDLKEWFNEGLELEYITDTDSLPDQLPVKIYCTNYERVRKGDINPDLFGGTSMDEASILRNLKTETTNYVLEHFGKVPYRFVATATPTPNDYIEILNYADYLGVIDRGHALTRFFQRDSTKAGNLTLYPNKKEEFWKWVATWAVFINKPSDLGFDDTGYNLPTLHVHEIEIENIPDDVIKNKNGDIVLFKDTTKSLVDTSREKSETVQMRIDKAFEIVQTKPTDSWILWHHLESERQYIEKKFNFNLYKKQQVEKLQSISEMIYIPNNTNDYSELCDEDKKEVDSINAEIEELKNAKGNSLKLKTVYGSQSNQEKESILSDFKKGDFQILGTKPKIAGSGSNFQHVCWNMVFCGIDYKFNDFIQAIHRSFRFRQEHEVHAYLIFTQNEREVLKEIYRKWKQHEELQREMINLVREFGLNSDKVKSDMKRQIFSQRRSANIIGCQLYNEDTVVIHQEMPDNHTDMILTSIPFGDHYEYSDNYNDFGHNDGNEEFFKQMDFLTPNLHRTLKPGRIAAIHVKDRIRYSYQNGAGFTTISDFSGQTVQHFEKHGFYLVGKITVTTDVVRENNQTYRLGWGEQRKDATKMGVGIPEYILLFRKKPTDPSNAYADDPVLKSIDEYLLSLWQLDAHSYWKSSGDRLLSSDEIAQMDVSKLYNWWKKYDQENIYNFQNHLQLSNDVDAAGKLSKLFMTFPPTSNQELVWTDINRMLTLNANQANRKKEKHICPLQLDIIERLINRFTMKGDVVDDPFGGLFSTAYTAAKMQRKAISTELNPNYYDDGLFYMKQIEYQLSVPTLFDMIEQ